MKKLILPFLALLVIAACNNADKKHDDHSGHSSVEPKSHIDSLMKEIDELHVVGMSKMAQLTKLQQRAAVVMDSINNPAIQMKVPDNYKAYLTTLLQDLNYADVAMDKWMTEYFNNTDTLADKPDERLIYLDTELMKVTKLKDAILSGIQKTDSLLNAKR